MDEQGIPQSEYQLLTALGREIWREAHPDTDDLEEQLAKLPSTDCTQIARRWCQAHQAELRQIVALCKAARRNSTPYFVVANAVANNINGIKDTLTRLRPTYLAKLFKLGIAARVPWGFLNLILCLDPDSD